MLKKLEVEALRGATKKFTLPFEKGKHITIVYGENGAGKSTICDAFEFLSRGTVSSLDKRGLGRTEEFWPSTGKNATDISVTIEATNGTWTAKVSGARPTCTPTTGFPFVEVLRRGQVLDFIATQPKTRYDAISPFIDISTIESSELSLRRLLENERRNRDTSITRISENLEAVENFWRQAGSPGNDALVWARAELQKDTSSIKAEISMIEDILRIVESLIRSDAQLKAAEEKFSTINNLHDAIRLKADNARAASSDQVVQVIPILESALKYFHSHPNPEQCPLCTSKEFTAGLAEKVSQQLESVKTLRDAISEENAAAQQQAFAKRQLDLQRETLLTTATKFSNRLQQALPSECGAPKTVNDFDRQYSSSPTFELARKLAKSSESYGVHLKQVLNRRIEMVGLVETLNRAVANYDVNHAAQLDLAILIPRLETALSEAEQVRRDFVDSILTKISERVGNLYEKIHPGEGLNKISLLLDPSKRASLEVRSTFPGTNGIPPAAYFSDSHLDTLGLCIWLALAELRNSANTILILDDIVTSADEPHVERVIELLYDVSKSFKHCIFTTHYQAWRAKYRWGWIKNGQCHFVELLKWEHSSGLQLVGSLPPIEELRELLTKKPPSPQLICASAGVILEAILDFLTLLYECSVPRRKGKHTLGDLLPSINKKLRNALKVERLTVSESGSASMVEFALEPIIDELERIAQARNVFGCHFNELAQHLLDADAINFATLTLTLADYLIDPEFGWPRSDKSGSYWSNSSKTRILHPLKHPH